MKIAEKVRKFAKLKPAKMAQFMGMHRASYAWLEAEAKKISLEDLGILETIYIGAGGTAADFAKLVRECR